MKPNAETCLQMEEDSMTKIEKSLWGRKLQLKACYDCLEGQEITPSQEEALDSLLNNWSGAEASLDAVKRYCEKNSDGEVRAKEIDNVYKYVVPKSLFVMRKPKGCVAIMCDFRFDLEHGIAIVLKNGKLDKITDQDSVI